VEAVFPSTVEVFPLDTKMCLVCNTRLMTNPMVKAKAISLCSL